MIREFKLTIMVYIVSLALKFCPDDAIQTLLWFKQMPFEVKDENR